MRFVTVFLLCIFFNPIAQGQAASESAVGHMSYLADREEELSKKYLTYISEVAHGSKARKMERRREDLINAVQSAIRDAAKLRPFKGDAALRDAFKEYWAVLLSVFKEDYHKIVDMEEIAERSYDAMEAYLLTQEKAGEKLDEAYSKVPVAYKEFAERNNITLTQGQSSKLSKKLDQAGRVNKYMNQLFLIYFKSTVQETLMLDALNAGDVNGMEQSKNSMLKYSEEGLARLDSVKPFKGDGSVITACRKVLEFQKKEADKVNVYTDFLVKKVEYDKLRKTFEAKPAQSRTKQEVDAFNMLVNDYNNSVGQYNKVNNELNTNRNKVQSNWDVTRKRFMDHHIPKV